MVKSPSDKGVKIDNFSTIVEMKITAHKS